MKGHERFAAPVRRREPLPYVSADERAFWRRAVEIERALRGDDKRGRSPIYFAGDPEA